MICELSHTHVITLVLFLANHSKLSALKAEIQLKDESVQNQVSRKNGKKRKSSWPC